ncbi:L,D-transpeptidase family protein [Fulvivirga sp. M361]|uniref:L,D-transpeptidase family protein n=1 Tax=Fulvivirga sp. M361 TaxID=2594266 RepID=UPI001179F8FF|nr:L,D-transpeptidase family protein [Fulvivirga sp. M361]TRX48299.1 L,D-transpeptidase family protein [Fulvivirga sp. M361]
MKLATIIILICSFNAFSYQVDFLGDQKRYKRVRTALAEKEKGIISTLQEKDIEVDELNILISAFKAENELELYVKRKTDTIYRKAGTYNICASSGQLGPKHKQGDYQVPEGFYYVDRFNPASSFFLSLGLNYPNQSDRKKSKFPKLGGDIFIHGSCVTIGCLPMTDNIIKELYVYAVHAKNNGQSKIPVYIFPFRMTPQNFGKYENDRNYAQLIDFWRNLKKGYDTFSKSKRELKVSVNSNGDYVF